MRPMTDEKIPRIYKLLQNLFILAVLFFAYYVLSIVIYFAQFLWPGHYPSPVIADRYGSIILSSNGSNSSRVSLKGKYLGHSISPSTCMVTPQYLLLISSSRDWLLIKPLSSGSKGSWIHIGADITHISCNSQSALLDIAGGGALAINLHTGKVSRISGVLQVRGKYTSRSYAGITSAGEFIMLPAAHYSSVFNNASSFIKLAVGNHGTGVIRKMSWDYDPATNRIAEEFPFHNVRLFKGSTSIVIHLGIGPTPGPYPAAVYLDPETKHVWAVLPFIDQSRLAVYTDEGDYLGHSVMSICPHWMQPLTLSEYNAMAEFSKKLKPESVKLN